ncbi:uncharacterized protein LOC141851581 [Brevipalpus obovatus]|uniref:uncharacterized protein LOC141851581 n=1 Tax=Brevipalpus obovatus TaxID=246614 RepID=UPI003D9E323A
MTSYNHILRYRLDEILRSLRSQIEVTDDFMLIISTSYLQIYGEFENSRRVLCQLMGSTFFGVFSLILNFFILYLTTETVFQLRIFSLFGLSIQISVIFLLGIIVVHLSSVKGREVRKNLSKILNKGSLKPSTRCYLIELDSMIIARPIVYGCFDVFRLTTMNVFKFYQEAAAWVMLLATSLKTEQQNFVHRLFSISDEDI